jgi:hypothetical protein
MANIWLVVVATASRRDNKDQMIRPLEQLLWLLKVLEYVGLYAFVICFVPISDVGTALSEILSTCPSYVDLIRPTGREI